jgi:acetoin utilization deacetylase AcuC-like enzyme
MSCRVISNPRMMDHAPSQTHPESPARLAAIEDRLDRVVGLSHQLAEPVQRADLELIHPSAYVDALEALRGERGFIDADTLTSEGSIEASWLAAGAAVEAARVVIEGEAKRSIALVRPPGHHAEPDRAMGFCFFSNVAIAAAAARARFGRERILIVDWDVHHGNGTQRAVYERDDILFFSAHQSPLYPGTGASHERGRGAGIGFTVNAPLPPGMGDGAYRAVFDDLLRPTAARFRPDLILVSAGFDAHACDPLAQMRVSSEGFASLCATVSEIADEYADGRLALVLEGGYDLRALSESVAYCAEILLGAAAPTAATPTSLEYRAVQSLLKQHSPGSTR